jgi:hypothetical protein
MRGDVRVETSPEGGARLVLTLPVASRGDEGTDGEGGEAGAGGADVGVDVAAAGDEGLATEPEADGERGEGAGANALDVDADVAGGGPTGSGGATGGVTEVNT